MSGLSTGPQHQGKLEKVLKAIFPVESVLNNARKEASIKNPSTGNFLEVDVWFPDLNICFEYQDDYHYQSTWYSHVPLSSVQDKDNAKRSLLLQRRDTLVLVPYWWDGSLASLRATIKFHRPDLLPQYRLKDSALIPVNPPFELSTAVPQADELMLASFPSSPEMVDVTKSNNWWLGEKYDGVRCFGIQ